MKKINELVKPFLSIIFGALLLLVYLNWLSGTGSVLALGIIAIILAAYYLCVGILGLVIGDKLAGKGIKTAFDVATVIAFPTFLFVKFLLTTIQLADVMGPTAWLIAIVSMIGSIALAITCLLDKLVNNKILHRISYLFASVFALVLLLNVLFDFNGNPVALGNINVVGTVLYILFVVMLMNSVFSAEKAAPEQVEETKKEAEESAE